MEPGGTSPPALLSDLLRDVSRSFYQTLRILPGRIRPQVSLAYLLARTTDTVADTELLPVAERLAVLSALRDRILGVSRESIDFGGLARQQGSSAERVLLENANAALGLLRGLSPEDRARVQEVLKTIMSGQELDLQRFGGASAEHLVSLYTDVELDDYTYRVAGCVGEFWTRMCRAHLFPDAPIDEPAFLANGVRFGKGLQLANILRDIPTDLRHGRCYLPVERLAPCGLEPADLLKPASEPRLRPLYQAYLDRAEAHLKAGWTYTNTVPRGCVRLRLACAWPILIGFETLKLLRAGNVLDPAHRIKIPRRQVKQIMLRSVVCYPWSRAWRNLVPQ